MSKINLTKVGSGYNLAALQTNFDKIEEELNDKVLYRDNPVDEPNEMSNDLDMNSNQILNLPKPVEPNDPVRLQDLLESIDLEAGVKVYPDLDSLLSDPAVDFLANAGAVVRTTVHNSISKSGGAFYKLTTLEQARLDKDDPLWVPDGAVSSPTSYNGTDYLGGITVGADHYIGGGTNDVALLLHNGQPWDATFGTIGTDQDPSGIYDDYLALAKFFDYCRTNRDGASTGGLQPFISPRSSFWISDTIDLLNFFAPVNWNGTDLFPISPITLINYESVGSEMSSLFIRHSHLPTEALFDAKKAAITFSGGQPSNVNSETVFNNLNRILIYDPWRGIELNSLDANNGGLIWQSAFDEVTVWNALDYGFYFYSVEQVSTTTAFRSCHTKCVFQDTVQHNGFVYYAIQHMPSSSPVEPDVTSGWEDYWRVKESSNGVPTVPSSEAQWESGTFYRTNGKGYYINNVQTCAFYNCSADGSNNWESGAIMFALNSVVTIDAFHLEGARLVKPDSVFFDMNCDLNFGTLYMYDLQVNLPDSADRAPLIGGTLGRSRVGELLNVRNHTQNAVRKGNFDLVRLYSNGAKDFGRFHTGVSINTDLITGKEFALIVTSDQDVIDYRAPDVTFTMASPTTHYKIYETTVPAAGAITPTYEEFNDIIEVSVNSGNDSRALGKFAKVRVSVFVQSGAAPDLSYHDVQQVEGDGDFIYQTFDSTTRILSVYVRCDASGQTAMSRIYGRNSSFDGGTPYKDGSTSRLLATPEIIDSTVVESLEGYDSAPLGRQAIKSISTSHTLTNGDSGYWLYFDDAATGTITIPDGLNIGTSVLVTNLGTGDVGIAMGTEVLRGATTIGDGDGFLSLTKITSTIWQCSERA